VLVFADAPVSQIHQKAQTRIANDELTAGVLPAFLVHDQWREEPNPEHPACLTCADGTAEYNKGNGALRPRQ